jgi:hypothetical protein
VSSLLWTGSSVAAATKDLPTATPPAKLTTADAIFGGEKNGDDDDLSASEEDQSSSNREAG